MLIQQIHSIGFDLPKLILSKYFNKQQCDNKGCDSFVKSQSPSFCGSTSAGTPLKKLKDVICPYFGIKMINSSEIGKIHSELEPCTTVKKAVKYLQKYMPNMQKTEKRVFLKFMDAAPDSSRMNFQNLLQNWFAEALTKLKLEELSVIDDIDEISKKLSPETALAVRIKTTDCRNVIINDDPLKQFKRKTILYSIEQIPVKPGEEQLLEALKDRANYLPTSGTSENAFIVKYARRSHYEISKRLVMASVSTIEHIKPDSMGGENSLKNFLLVSANANSYRQNMPLKKYIARFPQIPQNCQKYINKIIEIIHKGGLRGHQTYPYEVKRTLKEESEGLINLNLSKFKFTKSEAKRLEKSEIINYKKEIKTRRKGSKTKHHN